MTRIVVGMSGGVDSSLTAVLLQEQGYEVIGVSMKLWPCGIENGKENLDEGCCTPSDARAVAVGKGIPFYTVDMEAEFRKGVVDNFVASYARGETPNPCIRCNENLKFGDLWRYSQQVGASCVGLLI